MGAYSPAMIINKRLENKIISRIVLPTLDELKKSKNPYTGFLYVGLMIKDNNPYLIEYNVRMGDPECQVILPRLETDIVKIINACMVNKLKDMKIKWKNQKCMTIVLCSKGYPGKYKKDQLIQNLEKIKKSRNTFIYHAGTKIKNRFLLSSGGRVLNVSTIGKKFNKIRLQILRVLKIINWKKGFYRRDIGWRVIKNYENHKR